MPLWEYKILSSKQTPFSHPGLLESFLNALGKDQWEIVSWRTAPENSLEFEALARRPAFKEWYLEGQVPPPPAPPPRAESRTRKDADIREIVLPENAAGEEDESIWEEEDDEMPENVFAAVRPFLKRNPQNNVLSGSLEVLAGKFGVDERELLRAFEEEGMPPVPAVGQRTDPVEHDGMIFWINRNQRGQTWINARPKGRERPQQAPVVQQETSGEGNDSEETQSEESSSEASAPSEAPVSQPAPRQSQAANDEPQRERTLLDRVRPMMRRNKRGSGFSGSVDYLCRALKMAPEAFVAEIEALGLKVPATAEERLDAVAIGRNEWYFNKASNGQIWINGRERRAKDMRSDAPAAPTTAPSIDGAEGDVAAPSAEAAISAPEADVVPALEVQQTAPAEGAAGEVAPFAAAENLAPIAPVTPEPVSEAVATPEATPAADASEASDAESEPEAEVDVAETGEASQAVESEAAFLEQVREHLKRAKRGAPLSSELTPLAGILGTDTIAVIERLVRCGLDLPGDNGIGRAVEWSGQLYWIERNEQGNLALISKEKARKSRARTSRSRK